MTKIGYVRTSTKDQHLDRQIKSLKQHGCDDKHIFKEQLSGKNTNRPQLHAMLDYIRDDDIVMVSSLDRLGRNANDDKLLIQKIQSKGATLSILDMPSFAGVQNKDVRDLLNNFMIDLFSYQASNERTKILERQRQGIEIAKEKGLYKGRKPKFTNDSKQVQKAIKLFKDNKDMTMKDISDFCNMSRSTLYRTLRKYNLK